jgi:integrase
MIATGARRAEVCGLRWSDFDADAGTLEVTRSYLTIPGAKGDRPTKTRSTRTISLDEATVEALCCGWGDALHLARQCGLDGEARRAGYIFSEDGLGRSPWRPDLTNKWWGKARTAAGMPSSIRMHDLRHFQATQLLDAGIPVPTVAARLGHANGTTTVKIYAHGTPRADGAAALVVGRLLADDSTAPIDCIDEGRQ